MVLEEVCPDLLAGKFHRHDGFYVLPTRVPKVLNPELEDYDSNYGPMQNTDQLFIDAFGGTGKQGAQPIGAQVSPDTRIDYFQAAFGQAESKLPDTRHKTWRLNTVKASRLSFSELMDLEEHRVANTPYTDLPLWLIESGVVAPTNEEKARQSKLDKETNTTISERKEIFDAFQAQIDVLAAFATKESLKESVFLESELQKTVERYGAEEVMSALREQAPQAAMHIETFTKVRQAEAKQAALELEKSNSEDVVRAEIKAAQEAIAQMGGNPLVADAQQRMSEVVD